MTDNRLGRISDILAAPPRRPTAPVAAPIQVVPDPSDGPTDDTEHESLDKPAATPLKPRRPKPAVPARRSATEQTQARVAVRIAQELNEAWTNHSASHRLTRAAVVLAAVQTAHDQGRFPALLAAQTPAPASSGLFTHTKTQKATAAAKVTIDFRVHHADLDILDDLVREYGAADRTQFITAALTDYLTN